jgi:hypothetical protein
VKKPSLWFLLALTVALNVATVCWAACSHGDYSDPTRYTCNQATGVSSSFTPDPVSHCGYSINYCYGCNTATYPNQERDQTWNGSGGSACSGSIIRDTGWYGITPSPLANDYAYSCC